MASTRRSILFLAAGVALLGGAGSGVADDVYPTKPVRIIVPSVPGGVSDISARLLGDFLTRRWGHQVLIENRPGAGSNIGLLAAAASAPDGYTLFSSTNSQMAIDPVVAPALAKQNESFIPIGKVTDNPIAIVANKGFPANTLPELVAAARANPGKFTYATAGIASVPHLAAEWVAAAAGIKLRHIPFKGGAPSAVAAASGEVPLASIAYSSAVPFVKSGKIKPIAVTSAQRVAAVPDWPTAAEGGYRDVDITVWTGLFAIKGTPPAIVRKLEKDLADVTADPAFRERLEVVGAQPGTVFGKDFADQIGREIATIGRVVEQAGIRIE